MENENLTIEEIKALFFDANALREPDYKVYQMNADGMRYYYRFVDDEPVFYPSVTTILHQTMPTPFALLQWMKNNGDDSDTKRDLAASYGTFMHIQFEKLVVSRRYDFDAVPEALRAYMEQENLPESFYLDSLTKIRKDVLAFAQFIKDYNVRPLAIEIGLVHPLKGYAGCVDMPCIMTDKKTLKDYTAIVDFKSGRKGFYESHEIQLGMYRDMWNINFPDLQIEKIYNFSPKDWRKAPTYNLKDQTDSESLEKIPYLLSIFGIDNAGEDKEVTQISGVLSLDDYDATKCISTLSLADIAKKRKEEKQEATPANDTQTPANEPANEPESDSADALFNNNDLL